MTAAMDRLLVTKVKARPILSDRAGNGITAGRLLLALTVIVSHSFALTGQVEPLVAETGQTSLGFLAVLGFFGLSGWLLAQSRERNSLAAFVRNRVLRIYPAYWLALLFGASVALAYGSTATEVVAYVATNLTILLPGASSGSAFGGYTVNGSLWTLGVEVACYLALAVTPARWVRPLALGLVMVFCALWVLPAMRGAETMLFIAFAAGASRVTVSPWAAGVAAVVLFALALTPLAVVATALAALGMARLPWHWTRDLSYGTYVFAYPVSKMLSGVVTEPLVMAALTMVVVLPLAYLSWTFIEEPALRLRLTDLRHDHASGEVVAGIATHHIAKDVAH